MGQHKDDQHHSLRPDHLAALEAVLTDLEKEPIPPRIRELSLQLQKLVQEAVARKRTD